MLKDTAKVQQTELTDSTTPVSQFSLPGPDRAMLEASNARLFYQMLERAWSAYDANCVESLEGVLERTVNLLEPSQVASNKVQTHVLSCLGSPQTLRRLACWGSKNKVHSIGFPRYRNHPRHKAGRGSRSQ